MNRPRLDPLPYRRMMGFDRFPDRKTTPNYIALVFEPRDGYSNNPEDYSFEGF